MAKIKRKYGESPCLLLPLRDDLESLLRDRKLDHTLDRLRSDARRSPIDDRRWRRADRHRRSRCTARRRPSARPSLRSRRARDRRGAWPSSCRRWPARPRAAKRWRSSIRSTCSIRCRRRPAASTFTRMLWVRGEASSSARVSLSCEYGTLQKSARSRGQGAELVLQAGGFGVVVLDLGEVAAAGDQAAAVHDLAAPASRHRRQRNRVRADWQRADCAQRRGRRRCSWPARARLA